MPRPQTQTLRLAVSQCHTLSTTALTLQALESTTKYAASKKIDLVLFPEAYLGGYPRGATFGSAIGKREEGGREQFLKYWKEAVDLGDTPEGAGERWVRRELEVADGEERRGDGTREELERVSRETGVVIVVGLVERCAGSLYCGVVYVCPRKGVLGKRRKVMPTGSERLIWAQGQPSSLRAVTTTIKGVKLTLAAAVCWENYMPLLRQSLYSQNVNLYLAPTADGRDTWLPLLRTIACEGRCFVLSANQCVREKDLPEWISGENQEDAQGRQNGSSKLPPRFRRRSTVTVDGHEIALPSPKVSSDGKSDLSEWTMGERADESEGQPSVAKPSPRLRRKSTVTEDGHEIILPGPKGPSSDGDERASTSTAESSAYVSHGGSCIISPFGEVMAGPLWDDEDGLVVVDVDFDDCVRGRLDLDVGGSYSRNDSFRLTVEGLDLSPPP